MIPILYPEDEVSFDNNGLGRLSDAISCIVTEERNGIYELEMQYGVTGRHYNDIALSRIVYAKPSDGKSAQAFRIYRITKPINGVVTVYAEHISYQLNYIPVMPFTESNCPAALQAMKLNAAEYCPFEFWTDKGSETSSYTNSVPSSIRQKLGGQEGSILGRYGGEFEWDNWTVKLWTNRGANNGVQIRYGKNLTDLTQEENITNTYTGICPFWTSDEEVVTLPEQVLHSPRAENFPYQRTLPVDMSSDFDERPSEEELRTAGESYILNNNIGIPEVNLEVSFIALWQTEEYKLISSLERINLCDTVTVVFDTLGVSAQAKVVKTTYNVLLERYVKIEIGDAKNNFVDAVAEQTEQAAKDIEVGVRNSIGSALNTATSKITGAVGGHIRVMYDANDKPSEILVMDTDDLGTAEKIIRMNYEGIAFSRNGYAGPFNSAWLIDGTFDAQNITVAHLFSNLIEAGTLMLGTKENEAGTVEIYDESNSLIGVLDKNGLKMYGSDGSYVLINNEVGFAGYDRNNTKLFWADADEFHMKKSVVEEEITLCNELRFIPIVISDNDTVVNEGIGLVADYRGE